MREDEINYQRFLEGDLEGFESLVLTYKSNLIHFIYRYIKDYDLAEDLAQDAFVEVYVHKERYRIGTNFKTYLFTIGRNKAVDYIRKYGRETTQEEFSLEQEDWTQQYSTGLIRNEQDTTPEHQVLKEEERQMLHDAMGKLKKEYQEALVLIDFEEMTYLDASKVLNKTLPQVKVLIYRARKALAKTLVKEGYRYEK